MGNKSSRRKSTGDNLDGDRSNNRSSGGSSLRRKNSKRNSIDPNSASTPPATTAPAATDKHRSCPPQMGGAVPYHFEEERHINVTLYRSYRNLNTSKFGSLRDSTPDIRVYRRSTGSLSKLASSTLPRNFGRSRSAVDTPLCQLAKSGSTSNGVLGKGLKGTKRLSSSISSTHKPVSASDFPSTAEIRRKLSLFEDRFCRALADRYAALPETVQLAALPIAFERRGDKSLSAVSLYDYFHNDDLPTDLTAGAALDLYIPVIPTALLHGVAHVRRDKIANRKLWTSLAGDVIMCIALEAAAELARIYEYQIGLLGERTAVELVAAHAADCVLQYVVTEKTSMDRNSAILGVTRATPSRPNGGAAMRISVIVGDNELKWDVYEIFKKPGLRTDVNLLGAEHVGKYVDGGVSPWKYLTTNFHDAATYGYRGQVLEWDYVAKAYKTSVEDEYFYLNQTPLETSDQDDLHRRYRPYMRLIGYDVMLTYSEATASGEETRSLAEYMRMPADDEFGRREVKPVYRPVATAEPRSPLPLQRAVLDGADLTRIQLPDANCAADLRARNARMMLAEVAAARIADSAGVSGADVSYSTISGRSGPLNGVTARHVSLSESVDVNGDITTASDSPPAVMGSCASRVSDGDGKVSTVYEAVERKQRRIEAAEKAAQAKVRAQSGSSGNNPETRGGRQTRAGKAGNFSRVSDQVRMSDSQFGELRRADSGEVIRQRVIQTRHLGTQLQTAKTPMQSGMNGERQATRAVSNPHIHPDTVDATVSANPVAGSPPLLRREKAVTQQQERSLSTTYINATRSDAVTSSVGCARITKSVSHHGPLPGSGGKTGGSIDGVGMQSGRRVLSHAELEYIRRSQIFRMIRKIHVNNLEGGLPNVRTPFVGRVGEVTSLTDLLDTSGRLVTLTGEPGCGKSQLAIVVAHAVVSKHHVTAIYVDARGCATTSAVSRRLQELFNLHMRETELCYLYNWFNSHEQRLLFVFDNVDLATSRDTSDVSAFIDELAANVHDVRVLCTSRRAFYTGNSASATSFALGDLRQDSENLLRQLTPDLHDDGIRNLADACDHVAQALMMASRGLTMPDVDAGQLFEDLTTTVGEAPASDEDLAMQNEDERARKVLACLRHILHHTGESASSLIQELAQFASWFDLSSASRVGTISDKNALESLLTDLAKVGFLETYTRKDIDVYYMPHNTRLLAKSIDDAGGSNTMYKDYILGRMHTLQDLYYSPECGEALRQFSDIADDIEAFLRSTIERGTAYRDCCHLAAIDSAIFLQETLRDMLYEELYTAIRDESDADASTKCRALCCLSYQESGRGDFTAAKRTMTVAHDITDYLAEVDDLTKAFCYECLALVYWSERDRQDPALALMKRALDIYKVALGMRNARTLLANEHYGAMLARRMRLQSARHFFNVSDFAIAEVLDAHALLVRSYDERRAIWDALQLYGRSVEAARKAADIARMYQGEHPLTANMLAKLCDAVMRRGSLHEAIDAATDTLHLRLKVLGDHDDTAASYKVLAYLMVRSGQYDEAIRFAQSALDIHSKGDTDDRRQVELKNLIAQARYRLEYKSSVFVQIESKDASRANVNSSDRGGETCAIASNDGKPRSNGSASNGERRVNGDDWTPNNKTVVTSNENRENTRNSITITETSVKNHSSAPSGETSASRVCAMSTEV